MPSSVEAEVQRRRLGDFQNLHISGCGMRNSGRNHQRQTGIWGDCIHHLVCSVGLAGRVEIRRVAVVPESCQYAGILPGAEYVPELLLAEKIISLCGNLVPRMHLQRQISID